MPFDDQAILDDPETVTYVSVRNAGDVEVEVPLAVGYDLTLRELMASGGRYQATDMNWTLRLATLTGAGVAAKPGDRIVRADGSRYTVLDRTTTAFAGFVKATARNMAVHHDLSDACDWYEPGPTQGQDDAGHREPTWVPRRLGLVCRFQPQASEPAEAHGKRVTQTRYVAVFEDAAVAEATHEGQLRWSPVPGEVRVLEVLAVRNAERIDELTQVECLWRGY